MEAALGYAPLPSEGPPRAGGMRKRSAMRGLDHDPLIMVSASLCRFG
jgi:hypothetical protein